MPITEVKPDSVTRVAVGVILKGSQVCIALRPAHLHKGGLWEFPGGKIEQDESLFDALARELKEELGIIPSACEGFLNIDWSYPDKNIRLEVVIVSDFEGDPEGLEGQDVIWVGVDQLSEYPFPEANELIVRELQQRFS